MIEGAVLIDLKIHTDYIELGAAMKLAGFVGAGGEAKHFILEGEVRVNGETDTRRGRKLRPGDVFEFAGRQVLIGRVGQTD